MEIVLQHEANGLFLSDEQEWVETSREARKFASGIEAVRFAKAARFTMKVRMIARYEQNQNAILLPLVGSLVNY
jgi:hypothetical protein